MGDNKGSKPTISLKEGLYKLLALLVFLEVSIPHLKAICKTLIEKPWTDVLPVDAVPAPEEVKVAAK